MEHKTRRRDILVDDSVVFDFYDAIIPEWVNSASMLRKWHKRLEELQRQALRIPREKLMIHGLDGSAQLFPDRIASNQINVGLDYYFDPVSEQDGVTAEIRLPLLNQVNATVFERLVPGMLKEKLIALLRSLPKELRRHFVPIPDTVERIAAEVGDAREPLLEALSKALNRIKPLGMQKEIHPAQFKMESLPQYLHMRFALLDDQHQVLDAGRDLGQLKRDHGEKAHASFVGKGNADIERQGILRWDFTHIPESVEVRVVDYNTQAYPALVDYEDSVAIEIFDDKDIADQYHQEGVRRLLWFALPGHRKLCKKPLPDWQKISLLYAAIGNVSKLQLAMFYKAQDQVFFFKQPLVRHRQDFELPGES